MPRVTLNGWLGAVISTQGPASQRLRHTCHALASFMRGDGGGGCYPGTRAIGRAMHVSQRTASRDLLALEQLGWIETESTRRQYGRISRRYFPAVPRLNEPHSDSINPLNESAMVTQSGMADDIEPDPFGIIEPNCQSIEPNGHRIEPPSVALKSLTEISTEKSAPTPLPAHAGSGPQNGAQKLSRTLKRLTHPILSGPIDEASEEIQRRRRAAAALAEKGAQS